jgi:hypothetical protein
MIRILFLIVILILVLSFFGITIQSIVHSPAGQANFAYIGHLLSEAYHWIRNAL